MRLRGDEGWAGTTVLFLGAIFLLLAGVQVTLWFVGVNMAQAAAQSGYTVSRAYESNPAAGENAAHQILKGSNALQEPRVSISRTEEIATVTVTGRVTSVLPGIDLPPVTYTVTGPVERWMPAP